MSFLRFLLKSKAQEKENEFTETAATTPANETCSPPSKPDALLSMPTSTAEVPVPNPSTQDHLEKQCPPCISATCTLPDQQEEVSTPQCQVQQSSLSVVSGKEDGEKAGPSGLNTPSTSSFSATCTSTFIPFSGGGQRLGPRTGEAASSLTLPSQSAPSAAVDSPKAKKAKSSHSSSTQVSAII